MTSAAYQERRGELETYFDRTAVEAWSRLTSDAPVSRIRATVRAGRDSMRRNLLSWLPQDLRGVRLLDAGCGTGMLAIEAAARGADVVAIDLSPKLVQLARERVSTEGAGRIDFRVGDMLDPALGDFDYCVAMDSLIHYEAPELVTMVSGLAARARCGVLFTFAPLTRLLAVMHGVGRLFPRSQRAPAIEPIEEETLRRRLREAPELSNWRSAQSQCIARGFYISHAMAVLPR